MSAPNPARDIVLSWRPRTATSKTMVSKEQTVSSIKPANPNPDDGWPKELVRFCRAGRLYELEKWILHGKPLDISGVRKRGRQKSLLEIAVETGFHSMVELIA